MNEEQETELKRRLFHSERNAEGNYTANELYTRLKFHNPWVTDPKFNSEITGIHGVLGFLEQFPVGDVRLIGSNTCEIRFDRPLPRLDLMTLEMALNASFLPDEKNDALVIAVFDLHKKQIETQTASNNVTDFDSQVPEKSRDRVDRNALIEQYRKIKEQKEKEGYVDPIDATAMLEEYRAIKECPVDFYISQINSGNGPHFAEEMFSALSQSEVFIFHQAGKPFILPTPRDGLIVYIFTRASHANKFREEIPAKEIFTISKVSMEHLFMNVFPNRFFSLHVNPSSSSQQFQIQLPQMFVDRIYNLAIHGAEGIRKHFLATGLGIEGGRF